MKLKLHLPKKKFDRILLLLCIVLTLGGVVTLWLVLNSFDKREAPVVTYSTSNPSEEKIDKDTYQWQGTQDEPRYINLPSIGAGGFIEKVGVDQNQQIAVTTSIYFAGWFVESAKPGQKGLSIIDGHVTGRQNDGIFKNLEQLQNGDEYTVEMGDGTLKRYKVTGLVTVDVGEAANVLFSQDPKVTSQLNLITCGGKFDTTTQQYEKRVIVTSELING